MFLTAAIKTILFGANKKPTLDFKYAEVPQIDQRISWARNTTATVVDFEGLVKIAKANEARFTGGRRVENNLNGAKSEVVSGGSWGIGDGWQKNSCTTLGNRVTITALYGGITTTTVANSAVVGRTYVLSIELTNISGGTVLSFLTNNGNNIANFTLTQGIRAKYTAKFTKTVTTDDRFIIHDRNTGNSVNDIWSIQIEDVTGQANQAPSNYKSVGVLPYPYHGAGVDGVAYENTTNGNTVTNNVVTEAAGTTLTGITLLGEEARTNLLLNSATPATQNITTTAQSYTISMWGTGTCVLTGTATGTLTGTGSGVRTPITVTATAGTLTLTFAGSNTNGQAEAGASMSSYIPTTGAAVTRLADVPSLTGTSLNWYNPQQGTFLVKASGQYSSAPANIGVWNPLLTGEGTYVITYKNGTAYLWLPNAAPGVNPLEYQDIPTPTTILLGEQGILNLSRWTYYPKALSNIKAMALVNGTLTTAFDVSYAAVTNFTSAFASFPFGTRLKSMPKVNTSVGTNFTLCWYTAAAPTMPLLNLSSATNCTQFVVSMANLTTIKAGMFDSAKSKLYTNAFVNCALTQTSVDNILVSIAQSVVNTPTLTNGTLNMTGGTSATPSATGLAAKAALVAAGWTVSHN
jgi:hypothetical protein